MRTTLTLDDDVAAKLKSEVRQSGQTFREAVNNAIRRGLASREAAPGRAPFRVVARDLGALRPGLTLDNIGEVLDQVEGPLWR